MKRIAIALATFAIGAVAACSDASNAPYTPPPLGGDDAGIDSGATGGDGGTTPQDASPDVPVVTGPCMTTFRYVPPAGRVVKSAQVTGEWNGFANPGVAMTGPDQDGAFTAQVELSPGLVGYKLLLDGNYEMDPGARWHKYVGGVENSAVRAVDCKLPTLALASQTNTRPGSGQGHYQAIVRFVDGMGASGIDPASVKATLRKDQARSPLSSVSVDAAKKTITIDAPSLGDGKYAIFVDASDRAGHPAKTLRLVFWIEAQPFDWRDAVIYMAMIDRFKDGDATNNPPATAGVDPRADYRGGDLQGVTAKINDGTFDKLGIRAIWLSPFHTNPGDPWVASDGVHMTMGYHGYWPVKAREVDARIGGDAALKAFTAAAHAHGIRVLQDFVVNHVHQEHDYFKQHPEWFRTGCVCGTNNCDWTAHRLDCMFAPYMPDVNWTLPEVNEQWDDDAVYWLDTYDIDGLRIDAVKHVEDVATINLSARVRQEFEATGTKVFMTGETAMGWVDDVLADNQSQYDTISHYIGPNDLDGQFDFVLYHGVSYRVFAYDQKGMIHADYWSQASLWEYPNGAIMTPYIGSQDTARFVTLASYRGQDASHDMSIPGNQWSNIASAPPDAEPYQRLRLAMTWLLGQPGAPMVYYGDEYGEWGGADPNNRVMWRGDSSLQGEEANTLAFARKAINARKELVALRRGGYRTVYATDDALVFARDTSDGHVALVALNHSGSSNTILATLPVTLPLADGTVLHDRLGGADVTVAGGSITVTLGARGAAILAP